MIDGFLGRGRGLGVTMTAGRYAIAEESKEKLNRVWAIVDEQLSKTSYIAADTWTLGDIPMTIRVHRWALLTGRTSGLANIARYYEQLRSRESFKAIADPDMHLAG